MDIAVLRKGGSIEMCPNMIEIDDIRKVGNENIIPKKWSIKLDNPQLTNILDFLRCKNW